MFRKSAAIQDFRNMGANPKGAANPFFGLFSESCIKMKEIGQGGACPCTPRCANSNYLRLETLSVTISLKISILVFVLILIICSNDIKVK